MKHTMFFSIAFVILFTTFCFSQIRSPLIINTTSVEIVGCIFVKEYTSEDGIKTSVSDDELDKYRIAILTLKILKEAGRELKIAAADITLHYYHGENGKKEEVAFCDGISVFSNTFDVDRPLTTSKIPPGWMKKSTGTRTTASPLVYIDVAFRSIESDISKMWICFARPIAAYTTNGWTPNR